MEHDQENTGSARQIAHIKITRGDETVLDVDTSCALWAIQESGKGIWQGTNISAPASEIADLLCAAIKVIRGIAADLGPIGTLALVSAFTEDKPDSDENHTA